MQLVLKITLDKPLELPLNYNHIVQSIIYKALSEKPDYAEFLHDFGYANGKHRYKMFHFSQLSGDYKLIKQKIIFQSDVSIEIRSLDPMFMELLLDDYNRNGITFGETIYRNIHAEIYDYKVQQSEAVIRMKSPVTVHSTNHNTKNSYFYHPFENRFYEEINNNFYRKYEAYYGIIPSSPIQIRKVDGSDCKKLVTRYQGTYITAWFGKFQISGRQEYLDFLYQTGLGAKNAQGFGMFDIM